LGYPKSRKGETQHPLKTSKIKGEAVAGFFISFEGIDKSGKSTQAEMLGKHLRTKGYEVVFTHEPGATELGKEIRHLVLTWKPQGVVDPMAEMFLFAADRAQHVSEVIKPALAANKIVITDRYIDSTLAYQGYGRGLDLDQLASTQQVATGGLLPDMTVWVDVDLETARRRFGREKADRLESEDDGLFERVRTGYEHLKKGSPNRFLKVDGCRTIEDVFEDIRGRVETRLEEHPQIENV
jgi:dTMP kinase